MAANELSYEESGSDFIPKLWDWNGHHWFRKFVANSRMKSSPVSMKMEAMSKNIPQRTVERKMRAKHSSYIYRVIKQDSQKQSFNHSKDLIDSIASEAARLCLYNKRRTITKREIETAMKNILSEGHPNSAVASASQ